jgi:hypothetical protein
LLILEVCRIAINDKISRENISVTISDELLYGEEVAVKRLRGELYIFTRKKRRPTEGVPHPPFCSVCFSNETGTEVF